MTRERLGRKREGRGLIGTLGREGWRERFEGGRSAPPSLPREAQRSQVHRQGGPLRAVTNGSGSGAAVPIMAAALTDGYSRQGLPRAVPSSVSGGGRAVARSFGMSRACCLVPRAADGGEVDVVLFCQSKTVEDDLSPPRPATDAIGGGGDLCPPLSYIMLHHCT